MCVVVCHCLCCSTSGFVCIFTRCINVADLSNAEGTMFLEKARSYTRLLESKCFLCEVVGGCDVEGWVCMHVYAVCVCMHVWVGYMW